MANERPKYKQIIDAAVEVIAENGYHASRVSTIASRANVADGTIYLYFKNKEDILISVFKDKMGSFIIKTESMIEAQATASDKLFTLIDMHFNQLSASPHLAIVTQLELRQSKPELRREINLVLKGYLDIVDSIILHGINEGAIRSDVNEKLLRHMIFGTLDESVTTWIMKSQQYDLTAQVGDVHELLTNGIFLK